MSPRISTYKVISLSYAETIHMNCSLLNQTFKNISVMSSLLANG